MARVRAETALRAGKRCSQCRQRKSLGDFARMGSKFDGLNGYCRSCVSIRNHRSYLLRKGLPAEAA